MSELTDLEICKRIAEIEHGSAYIDCDDTGEFINLNNPMSDRGGEMYNPLTDKALCFDLMVKHNIKLSRNRSGEFVAMYSHCRGVDCQNPQAAICLAIIEANKEQ